MVARFTKGIDGTAAVLSRLSFLPGGPRLPEHTNGVLFTFRRGNVEIVR